jgi:hypothetical protein
MNKIGVYAAFSDIRHGDLLRIVRPPRMACDMEIIWIGIAYHFFEATDYQSEFWMTPGGTDLVYRSNRDVTIEILDRLIDNTP